MFRPIRKANNEISEANAKLLLTNSRRGVLSVNGDNGYPYAVPVNYLYDESSNKIIIHGARSGHKVDSIKHSDKVCFTVIGNESIKNEEWAPFLQSVIVFGKCRLIDDKENYLELITRLSMKYYPNEDMVNDVVAKSGAAVQMFVIDIEHLSGKEVQEK